VVRDAGTGVEQMFAVVQHQQQFFGMQIIRERVERRAPRFLAQA
jgi:hypothetical protein